MKLRHQWQQVATTFCIHDSRQHGIMTKGNQVNTKHVSVTTRQHEKLSWWQLWPWQHVTNDNILCFYDSTASWHNVTYKLTRRFENTSVWQIIIMIKLWPCQHVTMKIRHSDIIIKAIQLTKCHHVNNHVAMYINTSAWQISIMKILTMTIVTMSTRYHEDTSQWHYH